MREVINEAGNGGKKVRSGRWLVVGLIFPP